MSVLNTEKKAGPEDWHRADVVAALHKKGWSLRSLSRHVGLSDGTLKTALDAPYLRAEKIIADALGIAPENIWPTRYAKRNFTPVISAMARVPKTQANPNNCGVATA